MKAIRNSIAVFIALVMILFSGCAKTNALSIDTGRLLGLIGKNKADVCAELDFAESELTDISEFNDIYKAPITVEYFGLEFSLHLSFDINGGQLWRVALVKEYSEMTESCAQDIVKLAKEMVAKNGEPKQGPQKGWGADSIEENEIPTLYKKIINGPYSEKYIWYHTDSAPENVKKCMEEIGSTQFMNVLYWDRDTERKITPLTIVWQLSGGTPITD